MTDYFIGDIQGCYNGLQKALSTVQFNKGKDTLWLTGDLVARGEDSLSTLDFLKHHDGCIQTVLGNHDLHFLSVANGVKRRNPKDRIDNLLNHPNLKSYCDWLRHQPLVLPLPDEQGFMSHAGLPPAWQSSDALNFANELQVILAGEKYKSFLINMYSNEPSFWHKNLSYDEQLVYAVNGLTRMRYCSKEGTLDFKQKGAPCTLDDDTKLIPWFDFNNQRFNKTKWVFGHWASLMGQCDNPNIIPLDTGYVWGNHFTLLNWQTQQALQIPAST